MIQHGIIHWLRDLWRTRVLHLPPYGHGVLFRLKLGPKYRKRIQRPSP